MTVSEKFENFHSRGQIDLLDIWIKDEAVYKYLFIYQDCFSKFVVFKAMRTNSVRETARKLLDVITMIGAPQILQSSKGREFTKEIVDEVTTICTNFSLLHGETLKLEESNRDFRKSIDYWLAENPTKSWLDGIKVVQAHENTTFKHLNGKVPFDLLYNCNVKNPFNYKTRNLLTEEDVRLCKSSNVIVKNFNNFSKDLNSNLNKKTSSDMSNESNTKIKSTEINQESVEFPQNFTENNFKIDQENKVLKTDFHFVDVRSESPIETLIMENSFSSEEEEKEDNNEVEPMESKDKLKCSICQKKYNNVRLLKKHEISHTKAKYDCKLCSKSFHSLKFLNNHIQTFHNEDKPVISNPNETTMKKEEPPLTLKIQSEVESCPQKKKKKPSASPSLKCSYCQQKFDFPSVLKRHVRSHTNERPYSCKICQKRFKQLGHLTQHSVTHVDYRLNECSHCGIKFDSLEALKLHSRTHQQQSLVHRLLECDVCKKVFASKGVLERHVVTHTHERQFSCQECGKRFKQAGHVKSHMLVHTGEKKFACNVCDKRFSLANSLRKHMYVHNGQKPHQCDVCGARFLEKRNLNGHLTTHTNERPYACKICGKRYTLADTLRRHISSAHEEGRTYQCEICAKMFKQLAHLSVHKKVHTDERPFQCHLCEKSFKHNNVLKSHLAIHANLRPFQCDLCQATFVRKTNLQTHIASAHMNERPHVCRICGKRFKQVSHLNGHVVVHSNSMPYQCSFCDRRCNRLDNLKKHMKLHERSKVQ